MKECVGCRVWGELGCRVWGGVGCRVWGEVWGLSEG